MRKILLASIIALIVSGLLFSNIIVVRASNPTLSIYATGSGDSVQITVNGDPNANVFLYYQKTSYGSQSQYIGSTDSAGYFSTTISPSAYNISPASSVYVMVNNQQSQIMTWPYGASGNSPTLSQTNLTLAVGQTQNITIYGGYAPYSMYPSQGNIFQSIISGNTLTLIGQNTGSGSLNICSSSGGCVVLYITVNNSVNNYNAQISFNQNTVSLNAGTNTTVTIYGNGNYYISNNSNPNVASANISGNSLAIYGLSYGSDNITVCQNYGQCAVLSVSVAAGYNYSTVTPITFSQTNLNLSINQSASVSIYSGLNTNYYGGSYYIGYNSNSSSVQTNLNGSTLTLTGLTNSVTVIVVCSSSNSCGAVTITVGSAGTYGATYGQNWILCSNENQYCYFSGTHSVRYGINGSYYYQTFTNGGMCSNSVFGDPAFGFMKQCSYSQ